MAKKYTSDLFIKNGGTESEFLMADGSVSSGGGGGGSLLVQSLDTQSLQPLQWYSVPTTSNWLYSSLTQGSGGGAEPITNFRQMFFIKDKESLNDFYLSFNAQTGGNYEVYVASFDFTSSIFNTNKQILVHETFSAMGGAPFLKTDFNIATNTLNANSKLYLAIRSLDGNDTLSGLTMNYGFQA